MNEEGKLTNAGALLADESPIRQSRLFCTRWNGLDKASGVMDAIDDKEFSGSLVSLLQNGTEFVKNNSKMKRKKVGDGRFDLPDYPERSVLEGSVNALIHRDYLELGSEVHIDMFDDRLEIYSPGGMYDGSFVQDRDIDKIPSKRRNPVIADIFDRLKYMERRGSGFKKIKEDYRGQYLYSDSLKPEFYSDRGSFILTLKNLNYKKGAEKGAEKGAKKGAETRKAVVVEKRIEEIFELIKENPEITQTDIMDKMNVSRKQVQNATRALAEHGKIKRIGPNRSGYWDVNE